MDDWIGDGGEIGDGEENGGISLDPHIGGFTRGLLVVAKEEPLKEAHLVRRRRCLHLLAPKLWESVGEEEAGEVYWILRSSAKGGSLLCSRFTTKKAWASEQRSRRASANFADREVASFLKTN